MKKKLLKDYILVAIKGLGMGAADVVPGVSGGTIAFITGIYEELLNSIKSIDFKAIKLFFTFKWKSLWEKCNLGFLVSLFIGILISIFSLAKGVTYLLQNEPIGIWSFFFGLVLASTIIVLRKIKKINWQGILGMIIGAIVAYYITLAVSAQTPDDLWFIFLSGVIAICAMILPGISGSFILVLLGKYEYIINAMDEMNLLVLFVFAIGALLGLLSFARFLSWLFKKYHDVTIFILAGFMLGSLNKVWPWKEIVSQNSMVERNILPTTFQELGGNSQFGLAITSAFLGIAIILGIEWLSARKSKNS
ncbi:MAG: DUF368 domain-containing protein [Bacteroidales bacterium]|jgi:putative membrane protein|nr:DUF368 domain-containing protein [Bacteroidales bacterium]